MSRLLRTSPGALALLLLLTLVGIPSTAHSSTAQVPPAPGGPYFGPILDWSSDTARQYADRLGRTPSVLGQSVAYPLREDDRDYLRQFVEQASQQGALALLTLEPSGTLDSLSPADARSFGAELDALHRRYDTAFVVRFAPEMNGSWKTWGQQPEAYRAAFRDVADGVHAATPHAVMLWAPVYGSGYPFGWSFGAVDDDEDRRDADAMDTDRDGELDDGDDPYGPYYPGDDVVDWVGLTMYHLGRRVESGQELRPEKGEFMSRMRETFGYGRDETARQSFYDRYVRGSGRPFAIETGASYDEEVADGTSELEIKRGWWRQVFAPEVRRAFPGIEMIAWLEMKRAEPEVEDRVVDWRATRTPALADALRQDLRTRGLTTGPVTSVLDQERANDAAAQYLDRSTGKGDTMDWVVGGATLLLGLLLVAGAAARWRPGWRYRHEEEPRDRRIDFLRGVAIVAVVVAHVEVAGPLSYLTVNALEAVTGAELFVLLSGVVLGMSWAARASRGGEWAATRHAWRRARTLYVSAVAVVVLVWLVGLLPGVSTRAVTTFVDRGTGPDGAAARGQVYDLYETFPRLFDYPTPWYAAKQLLLLVMGPWVFTVIGLFVVLALALPALMWLVRRRLWWVLLAVSWVLYVVDVRTDWHLLPSQFEDVFPLLTWQVVFTHGLVLGHHRRQVVRALTTGVGRALGMVAVLAYVGTLLVLWARQHLDLAVPLADPSTYEWLRVHLYDRGSLQPGRLLDLVLVIVTAYALLTACWKPLERALGWFYVPLGSASLYVFIVHVFVVVAVANLVDVGATTWWQGLLVHGAVLALVWLMVTRRFLFRLVPT